MYSKRNGTVETTDGTEIKIEIMNVDISPEVAREVFDRGVETGDWNWKEKVWSCSTIAELRQIIAAARFYYGWKEGSEKVYQIENGWAFKAHYAC